MYQVIIKKCAAKNIPKQPFCVNYGTVYAPRQSSRDTLQFKINVGVHTTDSNIHHTP